MIFSSDVRPRRVDAMRAAATCLVFAAPVHLTPARAAIRTCQALIQSEAVAAGSELEGKKRALAQWRAQAAKLGPGYDGWHVAVDKVLKCFPKGTGFECMAVGRPCVIQHNPNQRPAGKDRKGEPL